MTESDLDAIEAYCAKATAGPWCWESTGEKSNEYVIGVGYDKNNKTISGDLKLAKGFMDDEVLRTTMIGANEHGNASFADAKFISQARTDLPALVKELRAARKEFLAMSDIAKQQTNTCDQIIKERDAARQEAQQARDVVVDSNRTKTTRR